MGRTAEPGLSYYRMNCGHTLNKKVRLLFSEFDSDGYWIWQCILDYAYRAKGYYFDCTDKDELCLFATDVCKKQVSLVEEVIAGCVRRGLFDKAVFNMFGVLTSVMMQEVYLEATKERRKKGTIISYSDDLLLIKIAREEPNIAILPGNKTILPGNNEILPGKNPQSKVKESKVKESIPAGPASPAPAGKVVRKAKEEEQPEPHWQPLVDTWFKFHELNFGAERPMFEGPDPRYLKRIAQRLSKRATERKKEWTQDNAVASLNFFLTIAFSDDWTRRHFSLKILCEKFEEIFKRYHLEKGGRKNGPVPVGDLQYLYERYCEGGLDQRLITVTHYRQLEVRGVVNITNGVVAKRINSLLGTNNFSEGQLCQDYQAGRETPAVIADRPMLMIMSVVEYFKRMKESQITQIV